MSSGLSAFDQSLAEFAPDDWQTLTPEELAEIEGLNPEANAPWIPFPGTPQETAFRSEAHELVFGGQAGGGKSALAVGLALTAHRKSLILRRQAVQVSEIVDQLKKAAGKRGSWRGLGYGGTMTTDDGRVVEVGGCDHPDDWQKYAGRPHDLLVFDETTSFARNQFLFLAAWNRTDNPKQRCRILLPTNPPATAEGRWIIEEFAPWLDPQYPRPAKAGELRWYSTVDGKMKWLDSGEPFVHKGERIVPRSRTFIPARLADNPVLMATDYGARLQALPEPIRSQLLYGDFAAGMGDDPWQVIPTAWVKAAQDRWVEEPEELRVSCLGTDVARGGAAATVLSRRHGRWFAPLERFPGTQTPDGPSVAVLVWQALSRSGAPADLFAPVNVDVVGVGASVYDSCLGMNLNARAINFGESAYGRDRTNTLEFTNLRAYAYWSLREALDPKTGDNLMLPPDQELLADLTAPKWEMRKGKIAIELKEKIRERIGRSPDSGDSVVLGNLTSAYATGAAPAVLSRRAW